VVTGFKSMIWTDFMWDVGFRCSLSRTIWQPGNM